MTDKDTKANHGACALRIPDKHLAPFYEAFNTAVACHRVFERKAADTIARKRMLSGAQLEHLRHSLTIADKLVAATCASAPASEVEAPGASMNFGPLAPCGNLIDKAIVYEHVVVGYRHWRLFDRVRYQNGHQFCVERARFHSYAVERRDAIAALLAAVDASGVR